MNGASQYKDLYADLEPKADTYFFRVGRHGLISFHGKNWNLKKRMTEEQRRSLLLDSSFIRVTDDVYVNVDKISAVEPTCICFADRQTGENKLPVTPRMRQEIMKRLAIS